jgi:hypothetical protein
LHLGGNQVVGHQVVVVEKLDHLAARMLCRKVTGGGHALLGLPENAQCPPAFREKACLPFREYCWCVVS